MIDYFFTPQCMNVARTIFFLFDANIQFKNDFQFAPPNLCSVKIFIERTTLKITAIGPDLDQPYLTMMQIGVIWLNPFLWIRFVLAIRVE